MRWIWVSLLVLGLVASGKTAVADAWPTRPVRIVLTFAAGGSPDFVGRALAQKLSEMFGESVYVENRTGGNGNIGVDYVAKSEPDGYTLLLAADNQFSVNPKFDADLPYQVTDFTPISLIAEWYFVLVATPSLEADNIGELIALAKHRGAGKINFASTGTFGTQQLAMELLQQLGDFKLTDVPYRGAGQAYPDLLAGRTQLMLTGTAGSLPHLRSGQLKPLAVTSPSRIDCLPDVPTVGEQGFADLETPAYVGLYAPAGTPKTVVAKLVEQVTQATASPDFRERLAAAGLTAVGSTPEELAERTDRDSVKWTKILRAMGARDNQ